VNDGLEEMWKEVVMTDFKVLSKYLAGGIGKAVKNLNQGSQALCNNGWKHFYMKDMDRMFIIGRWVELLLL
jgi:hypothetical protein